MSTRSLIGLLNQDGSVTYIYCHWDGYPSNNGRILAEHYTAFEKIQQLLKLGDLSVLGERIGEKHPFETYGLPEEEAKKYEGMCVAYGRDRGEKGVGAKKASNIDAFKKQFTKSWAEYAYLFDDGCWYVYWDGGGLFDLSPSERPDDFIPVTVVLRAEQEKAATATAS